MLNNKEEFCFDAVELHPKGEWRGTDVMDFGNMIWEYVELLSFCHLQDWDNRSKLSRYCLGKVSAKSD